jgi:hypothetical protein
MITIEQQQEIDRLSITDKIKLIYNVLISRDRKDSKNDTLAELLVNRMNGSYLQLQTKYKPAESKQFSIISTIKLILNSHLGTQPDDHPEWTIIIPGYPDTYPPHDTRILVSDNTKVEVGRFGIDNYDKWFKYHRNGTLPFTDFKPVMWKRVILLHTEKHYENLSDTQKEVLRLAFERTEKMRRRSSYIAHVAVSDQERDQMLETLKVTRQKLRDMGYYI